MSRLRYLVLSVLAASAFALAACDEDTAENDDYVDQVNEVSSRLLDSGQSLSPSGGSPQQVSRAIRQIAARLGTAAADLGEIAPPEEVPSLHDKLVTDLETLEAEATNAANEVKAGGAASAVGVVGQFTNEARRIAAEIDSTLAEIENELQD